MIQALAAVIIPPDRGDMGETVVGLRGDVGSCGSGEGEGEGCADEQRDVEEKLHFDEGEEMKIAGREERLE